MKPSDTPHSERTDSEIYREAVELLKSGKDCRNVGCGWACCALSTAVGALFTKEETANYHRIHQRLVDRFRDATWWGKERSNKNTAARVEALLALAKECEEVAHVS